MRLVIALVVLAGAGGAGYYVLANRGPAHEEVATITVAKSKFVRRVTAEGNLRAVKATRLNAPRSGVDGPMKIAWLAPDGQLVKKGDVVVRFDPTDPEKALREGKADLDSANAKLTEEQIKAKTKEADRATDADLAKDERDQQKRFQAKDEQIYSRNQIIESEIDQGLADAKQSHAEKAKQIEKKLSRSNAAVIAVERQKAELAISHATKTLDSMQVVAPHDGILVLRRNWRGNLPKLGDQLWPGQEVAELPLLDTMEAEVFVLEVDGSGLTEKQPADVIVESRPDITYHGKIKLVEKLAQPRQNGSPVNYFSCVIELDKTDRDVMKPGQRVHSTLILDQEDAIVVPRQAVFEKDAKTIVYKKTEHGFDPTTVELGAATTGRVVIKKGLAPGDEIALRDPAHGADALSGSGSGQGTAK
jgi:multidrug efflux pump subunit AcrA (membrane-fusion protein)